MSDCNDPNHYDPADEIARATAALREALEDFLNCPMVVSEGTNPVIVTIHVARERVEKWRAALASAPSAAVELPRLTPREIADALKTGQLETAANAEYHRGKYDPERGGPALAALNEHRKQIRASASSAGPTPRDMRVAEAVCFESDCDRECKAVVFKAGYSLPVTHSPFCKHAKAAGT